MEGKIELRSTLQFGAVYFRGSNSQEFNDIDCIILGQNTETTPTSRIVPEFPPHIEMLYSVVS